MRPVVTPPSTGKTIPVIQPERESSAKNKTASVMSLACPLRHSGWKAGLTPRVLNYYFRRMITLGILEKVVYPEVPPHVEYRLTDFGLRFVPILDSIEELQRELETHSSRIILKLLS